MKSVYVNCPHCGDLIEGKYDIEEVGQREIYENQCDTCGEFYSFEITTKVSKI